jgi:hypothetical protein
MTYWFTVRGYFDDGSIQEIDLEAKLSVGAGAEDLPVKSALKAFKAEKATLERYEVTITACSSDA